MASARTRVSRHGQRSTVRRVRLGDGEPPAFGDRLLIECGGHTADPVRQVKATRSGCGRRYVVHVDRDVPAVDGP